jgi:alpha-1,2-mannosyltransferase
MTHPALPNASQSNAELFLKLALASGIMVAVLEVGYLLSSPLPYDPIGYVVGRDFANTWLGGRLALTGDPGAHFGFLAYNTALKEVFGPNYPTHIWSYPPHVLLLTWPLALMPYLTAYLVYTVLGLTLYLVVVSDGERRADHLLLLTLAPATIVNIWCGQVGFLVAALLAGGLLQLDRRPTLAGVLFGLLTIKPQLGLWIPLMLVLTGRWRTIAAAIVTIMVLCAATTLAFGPEIWGAYVNDAMPVQSGFLLRPVEHWMVHVPTAFMTVRIAGLPLADAIMAQALLSAAAIAGVVWTFWRRRDPLLSNALFITATFAVTPYAFNYDMVVLGFVAITLIKRPDNEPLDHWLLLAVWTVPLLTVPLGMAGIPASCLPVATLGGRLLWRLRNASDIPVKPSAITRLKTNFCMAAPPVGARISDLRGAKNVPMRSLLPVAIERRLRRKTIN